MERRDFFLGLLAALVVAPAALASGCRKKDEIPRTGSEEKLWRMAEGQGPLDEPLLPAYAKDTPAFFRDASLGKVDPSFMPKVTGG